MIYSIKRIHSATPFKLVLEFDEGEVKEVDLESRLLEWSEGEESIFKQLLDPEYFSSVKLNTNWNPSIGTMVLTSVQTHFTCGRSNKTKKTRKKFQQSNLEERCDGN